MRLGTDTERLDAVRAIAHPLSGRADEHDGLLALIGGAHFMLLGEASHGTHEFYRERARITRRLIVEKGFEAVTIEGDWPDAWRVHRFVRGQGSDAHALQALGDFRRFPAWMWRNTEVLDFIDWLRAFNDTRPLSARVGFYGLDLYSMHASMAAVSQYLERSDPAAARRARERYACFDRFGDDARVYGLLAGVAAEVSCENEVLEMLLDLRRRAADTARAGHEEDEESLFNAEQNARLVKSAEAYYRSMVLNEVSSWNLRDMHMFETLECVHRQLTRRSRRPKIVVWAHNSHLGDARATEMGQRRGELNLGQLMREAHGRDAVLVGFSTHSGTVTAARDWDGPAERMQLVPSLPGSHEALMHASGLGRFLLPLRHAGASRRRLLEEARLQRAVGVIYRPLSERQSHYLFAQLAQQFDALLHIDTTRALRPLDLHGAWLGGEEVPETFPSGM